jgi:Domain of unknown function (DUF4350)
MATSPTFPNKPPRWAIVALALGAIVLLIVLFAPNNGWRQSGSTYNKSPAGYSAWYDYMETRGVKLTRSRQPIPGLIETSDRAPKTLIQIQPELSRGRSGSRRQSADLKLDSDTQSWLDAGNHLIILGVNQPVGRGPFSSRVGSPQGPVVVETARRASGLAAALLADSNGAIVWQVDRPNASPKPKTPPGKLIYATTPHLAANAYKAAPGNYAFLADLVTQTQTPIIIDEYLHGYREPKDRPSSARNKNGAKSPNGNGQALPSEEPSDQDLLSYLAQTPLLPIAVQAIVLILIAIWAKNQRFGRFQSVDPPPVDNSTAYIQALAGALRQANSRSFVMDTINQAELRQLQRQMGLGDTPMTLPELIEAWTAQGRSADDLKSLLRLRSRSDLSDSDLLLWLQNLQRLREGGN